MGRASESIFILLIIYIYAQKFYPIYIFVLVKIIALSVFIIPEIRLENLEEVT